MRARDVMTANVVTVREDTTLKDVAALLLERGISGVPVVDAADRVVGVVSEGDLVAKLAAGRDDEPGLLGRLFHQAASDGRWAASTAGEAMTAPAVTIDAEASTARIARTMAAHGVKRLPVVWGGRLLGIVTRADLVRAFARPDEEIRAELAEGVVLRLLWMSPDDVEITVTDGRVELAGEVETHGVAGVLETFARRVAGVVSVDASRLTWVTDERRRPVLHH